MSEKTINYMSRDYNAIKNDLISLSQQYYPELADSFNDASVGSWIIQLVSAVGDELNYYIDRCYNEQNINTASLRSSVLNFARMNNVKIPGPKAATCEVEVSVTIPGREDGSVSRPKWEYAPKIPQGALVSNGSVTFEITEDINFQEQFNKDAVSNRKWVPVRNAQGAVTGYTITKNVIATAGRHRIYKKVITANEVEPFMEFVLPFQNVMEIEGIIFKETSNLNITPELFEFGVNAEKFRVEGESITTYRFFEVDSLTDQYIFGQEVETPGQIIQFEDPHLYDEYDTDYNKFEKTEADPRPPFIRYYKGSWMPIMQKYITEYTDNGYLKIIFGSGTNRTDVTDSGDPSKYAEYQLSKMVNNDLTGILPKSGWMMYILYRDGGGTMSNVSPNALTQLGNVEWIFDEPNSSNLEEIREFNRIKSSIIQSATVRNTTQALAGVDAPSVDEIKYLTKYNNSAQNRCVTLKDYEFKVKSMPAKYGAPYRCKAIEENNKILLYTLGLTSAGKLTDKIIDTVAENMVNYLSRFKSLGDYIEIRHGNIYNIQAEAAVYIDKTYNTKAVVKTIMQTIDDYFNVDDHAMGEDMFIGDLEKQISAIDGVANLISFKLFSIWGDFNTRTDLHKQAPCPLLNGDGVEGRREINLSSTNKILSCDAQGMFEISQKENDIRIKVATI